MIKIEKPLPGEFEGNINPEDYGFGVIREAPLTEEETRRRAGDLHARIHERTGTVIPAMEQYARTGTVHRFGATGALASWLRKLRKQHNKDDMPTRRQRTRRP